MNALEIPRPGEGMFTPYRPVVAKLDLTGLSAAVPQTNWYYVLSAGLYLISSVISGLRDGATHTAYDEYIWTENGVSQTHGNASQSFAAGASWLPGYAVAQSIYCDAGTWIRYYTGTSSTFPTNYNLRARLLRLE